MNSLPGNDLIEVGVEDLRHQRQTIPALLVAIGAPKLRSLGLEVPKTFPPIPSTASTISCPIMSLTQPTPNTTP